MKSNIVFARGLNSELNSEEKPSAVESGKVLGVMSIAYPEQFSIENKNVEAASALNSEFLTTAKTIQTNEKLMLSKYSAARAHEDKVKDVIDFLKYHRSPIANYHYADMFIRLSEANGADYRVVLAISGVESGFCIAPHKKYNCFGYLNKVQYSSLDAAMRDLIPKVSRQYARKYGTNFAALAKAYGQHNIESAVGKMSTFYSQLQ